MAVQYNRSFANFTALNLHTCGKSLLLHLQLTKITGNASSRNNLMFLTKKIWWSTKVS